MGLLYYSFFFFAFFPFLSTYFYTWNILIFYFNLDKDFSPSLVIY